jgi:hypothetical protein
LLRERKPGRYGGARWDIDSDRDADLRYWKCLAVGRAYGASTIGKRIYEDSQRIDPRVSVQANE